MLKLINIFLLTILAITKFTPISASCPRCIENREKNKKIKNEFFYYEDYLEHEQKQKENGNKEVENENKEQKESIN